MTGKRSPNLSTVLGIQPEETPKVLAFISASFFLGLGLVFFYTASNAIFLTSFDVNALPYVYIATTGISLLFNAIYSYIQQRTTVLQLLYLTNILMAVITLLFWVALQIGDSAVVIFISMTWFRVLYTFTRLGLVEIASNAFDVRQAKRIFSLVGVGTMFAFILGGLFTSPLVSALGTVNLFFLSVLGLLAYIVAVSRTAATLESGADQSRLEEEKTGQGQVLRDNYIRLILAHKGVATLLSMLAEFIFYAEAARRYTDDESLANFLGTFMGVTMLVMALVTVFVVGRFTERYGVQMALAAMPIMMGVMTVAALIYGQAIRVDYTFFLLITAITFFRHVGEKSFYTPTSAILFQPLPDDKRTAALVISEGWFNILTYFFSSLMLLLFTLLPSDNTLPYVYIMLAVIVVFLAITPVLHRQYRQKLQEAIATPFASGIDLGEAIDPDFLLAQIRSSRTVKVRFAFEHLSASKDRPLLSELLNKKSPNIRREALQRIEAYPVTTLLPQVAEIAYASDEPDFLRGQAIISMLALQPDARIDYASLPASVRPYALIGWLRYGDEAAHIQTVSYLEQLVNSPHMADRLTAVDVLRQAESNGLDEIVLKLLSDAELEVRRAAILMAGRQLTPPVSEYLIGQLGEKRHQQHLIKALSQGGDKVVGAVQERFGQLPPEAQPSALLICGRIGTPRALLFLKKLFQAQATTLPLETYQALLMALRQAGYQASEEAPLRELIQAETVLLHQISQSHQLPDLMRRALAGEVRGARQRIFLLLGFLYDTHQIQDIEKYFLHPAFTSTGNALEMLDVTLSQELKALVIPVLEKLPARKTSESPLTPDRLPDLMAQHRLSRWTQICIQYTCNGEEFSMSALIDKVLTLRGVKIFSEIPDGVLAEMTAFLNEKHIKAGETLIEKGTLGDQMYIITAGEVRVHDGETTLSTLKAGDIVGELAVLDPAPRLASVTAITETDVLTLHKDVLYDLMLSQPQTMESILRVLVQRFRQTEKIS